VARSAAGVVGIAALPLLGWPFQECSNHPATACGCGCPSLPKEGSPFAELRDRNQLEPFAVQHLHLALIVTCTGDCRGGNNLFDAGYLGR